MLCGGAEAAGTLDTVKARGYLKCGVTNGSAGFAVPNAAGRWIGFDVDYCRALAAAIFGDPDAVRFTPTTAKERFTALQSGEVDILARNTTWTFDRDVALGFEFVGVSYYDGQAFMVPKKLGVKSAKDLNGARVCVETGTTTELNLADYFRTNKLKYKSVVTSTPDDTRRNYEAEACDAYTTDASELASTRTLLKDQSAHVVLPEIISKEPLGPLVRQSDPQWADVGRWVLNALVIAEEEGVSSNNVAAMKTTSTNPEIRRLLGAEGKYGEALHLKNDWAYQMIAKVGNYGEIFDRNLGAGSALKLPRGLNALWNKGGLLYAPPIR
ncbi:MAG: amino acid ABC transporter substrate-binding protein [Alphaproteobacteria bacterium]